MSHATNEPLIQRLSISNLFGDRSYEIDTPKVDGHPSRLLLLHGDNGSGKTTLLRLLWHAVSAADNRGHRTYISRTPFSKMSIQMSNSRALTIRKADGLVGSFSVEISQPGAKDVTAHYEAAEDLRIRRHDPYLRFLNDDVFVTRGSGKLPRSRDLSKDIDREQHAQQTYLKFLAAEVKSPLYLADDRSLYSDDPDIERWRESLLRREERDRRDQPARPAFVELQITLRKVNEYLRSITLGGQNDGSANSNAIYLNVLRQLAANPTPSLDVNGASTADTSAVELLAEVANTSLGYEQFGLVPQFDSIEFQRILAQTENRELAERVVLPFLSSLKARFEALEEAYILLSSLIPTANAFLRDKELRFTPRRGLQIYAGTGDSLEVEKLSSGERQLIMLLCTTLLARMDTNLFIIDEPELSLGVEWQRNIMDALLGLTERTSLQFLVATHSIEIISSRPDSLVQLRSL